MMVGVDYAYAVRGVRGKDKLYYDKNEDGWTTLVWCTKFYSYGEAKKVKNAIEARDNGWFQEVKVVKCFFSEVAK